MDIKTVSSFRVPVSSGLYTIGDFAVKKTFYRKERKGIAKENQKLGTGNLKLA
jgi:hypothetical protein